MMFDGINLLAVLVAAVVGFVFGAVWYGVLGKAWMRAANLTAEQTKPAPVTMGLAFICQFVMAFVLAGVIYHVGGADVKTGLIAAGMIWVGFVLTTQIVNHRFQDKPWSLTVIDTGHWLGVLIIQAVVIGLIGTVG
jgi:glycerol uptake facilitator-like aquaporin